MLVRSWNDELRIATALFMRLFARVKIVRVDAKGNVEQTIEVPVVFGTRSRALKELESPNKTLKPPLFAVTKENVSRDSSRMAGIYDYLATVPDGHYDYDKIRGVPVDIRFTLAGLAKNELDIDQMISNWIVWFKPDVYVVWKHPKWPDIELKCPVTWDGNINYQSPTSVTQSEQEFFQFESAFTFHTWMFAGTEEAKDDGPVIETINIKHSDLIGVGEEGYGLNSVYVVPKSMTFEEYIEQIRLGNVKNTEFGTISVPTIIGAMPGDMSSIALNYCSETATSLTMTLLAENKNAPDYNPNLFGFNEHSELLDSNSWYMKADLTNDVSDLDYRYNYDLLSDVENQGTKIKLTSRFYANFDWVKDRGVSPFEVWPKNAKGAFSTEWFIKDRSDSNILFAFKDPVSDNLWNPTLPASFSYEIAKVSQLVVERYALRCSADVSKAPRIWTLEGYNKSRRAWLVIDSRDVSDWQPGEVKYFDVYTNWKFSSLRLTISHSVSGEEGKVEIAQFKAWSNRIGSEGPNSEAVVTSELHCSFSAIDDPEVSFSSTIRKTSSTSDPEVSTEFGPALTDVNTSEFMWFVPSLKEMSAPFFFPNHYLIFWARGRKYGVAPSGLIKLPRIQSITYGDTFPANTASGSLHVSTSADHSILYQYDEENNAWFQVGSGHRPLFNRLFPTADGAQPTEPLLITTDSAQILRFPVFGSTEKTYYFTGFASSANEGIASLQIKAGSMTSVAEIEINKQNCLIQVPFTVNDSAISSLEISLLPTSKIRMLTVEDYEIAGKLKEGDFIQP